MHLKDLRSCVWRELKMVSVVPTELSPEEKAFREKISSNIKLAIKTGKIKIGLRNIIRALQRGEAKMIIIASNVPQERMSYIAYLCSIANIPLAIFPGTVKELGEVCGRPHVVSLIAVIDPGTSEILKLGSVPTL